MTAKDCHGLRKAVDRVAPGLIQQQQNRRDQRSGVANTDPPDEIDDRESPADGNVDTPDADALDDEPGRRAHQQLHHAQRDQKTEYPADRDLALEDDPADLVRDRRKTMPFVDYRTDFDLRWQLNRLRHVNFPSPTSELPDWGCGSRSDKWCAAAYSTRPAASSSDYAASIPKHGSSGR